MKADKANTPQGIIGLNNVQFLGHCTEVRFVSFLSGEFTAIAEIHPPERKLANPISVHCILD